MICANKTISLKEAILLMLSFLNLSLVGGKTLQGDIELMVV